MNIGPENRLILKNQLVLLHAVRPRAPGNVTERLIAQQIDERIIEIRITLERSR